ncbi:putative N-acetylmannosamine-6-phosphate 2-epimerase [Actinomyces capricornis]|uniref:Putative N-acetylmannosamine-6-phosphate 2-epimerase n=1 Tax=Actinomyces capricornis TaxID=2755559 RepID=A0ABN6K9U0_9ACTO|nr:putative N-acetylmannosamine-6-phosphate 2-epimerase [Actinomyces capricornis]
MSSQITPETTPETTSPASPQPGAQATASAPPDSRPRQDRGAGSGHPVLEAIRGGLIASAQAYPGEPMRDPRTMDQVAQACVRGGAVAIRAQGLADLELINQHVEVPVIGLWKDGHEGVFITPTLKHAVAVAATGCQIVALDGTRRERPDGLSLARTIEGLREAFPQILVMADCGCLEDARCAQDAGADLLGTTLAGYTGQRPATQGPDLELVDQIAAACQRPLIVEGRVHTPDQAAAAMERGAWAVVVGTAITHPTTITSWFVEAVSGAQSAHRSAVGG